MAAGVAIEKARLYEEAQRRERWLAAGAEVTSDLLRGGGRGRVARLHPGRPRRGLVDTEVPPAVAEEVAAVLVEALSNVARHARAGAAEVRLAVDAGTLTPAVSDDGVGFGPTAPRSGLKNIAERAAALGGTFTHDTPPDGGARLVRTVPLPGRIEGTR